jgi:hypothetical protein
LSSDTESAGRRLASTERSRNSVTSSRRAQNQLLKQGLQVSMDQGFLNRRH